MCEKLTLQHPQSTLETYIDDLTQSVRGHETQKNHLARLAGDAGTHLGIELEGDRYQLAQNNVAIVYVLTTSVVKSCAVISNQENLMLRLQKGIGTLVFATQGGTQNGLLHPGRALR